MAKKSVKISVAEIEKVQTILGKADYIAEKYLICDEARDALLSLIAEASNVLFNAEHKKR